MPRIAYIEWNPANATRLVIAQANAIIEEYAEKGFDLTLRQLYYQFVARDYIPNAQKEYDRLGQIINKARLAGMIDWNAITDRTRNLRGNTHWTNPGEIIRAAARSFMVDKWVTQNHRIEVWIEKDALVGVISGICTRLDVPYFSCRGYTSQSEMWRCAIHRMDKYYNAGQITYIMHLGDHDPSGVDMTRDIKDRLELFTSRRVDIKRLALNMDQVEELKPPPNPAKLSDSRCGQYILAYGRESWELDALDPEYIERLIRRNVLALRDDEAWDKEAEREQHMTEKLNELAKKHGHDNW